VASDEEKFEVLAVDNVVLRLMEGFSNWTRVAFPIFATIVPLAEITLFGRLSSSRLPNVDTDLAEPGRTTRAGSANGLRPVSVTTAFSTSSALNATRPSGDRTGIA